jgi:transcriptional regulator with XRE-family HTH domain
MRRDDYEREIIDNIRKYRQARGLTQEELARRCDMQTGYIGGIETYKRFPKVKNLRKIAEALDIDIAYLMSPRMAERVLEVSEAINGFDRHMRSYLDSMMKPLDEHADQET